MGTRTMAEAAAGGLVASMVMSSVRQLTTGLGLVRQTPPEAVLKQGAPSVLAKFSRQRRRALIELAHWLYGAAGGLAYTLVPPRLRRHPLTGPTYGLVLWLVFDKGVAPLLQLPHVERPSTVERLGLLADHLVYGGIVSAALGQGALDRTSPQDSVPPRGSALISSATPRASPWPSAHSVSTSPLPHLVGDTTSAQGFRATPT